MLKLLRLAPFALLACGPAGAASDDAALDAAMKSVMPQVTTWRRDFHQNPELSNREVRTSKVVAEQLRTLGFEVRTGIAHTGVVGILRGAKPGPTIALRADMDALPVTEQVDVPFKSVATAEYRGEKVGVMHACGHDAHTAILLGVARILGDMRNALPGTVVFVFQPAEEGAPDGERGGASLMLDEGLFAAAKPEAMFGLHVFSTLNVGQVGYRTGPLMAASDRFRIVVRGRQTHGARPWGGVDPIVTAAQVVTGLQTIVARQVDIAQYPAVVSVGAIKGGIRNNIIPDSVEMVGTFRTFDPAVREQVIERIRRIATDTATAAGATAEFELGPDPNPVVVNDPSLTARAVTTLERVTGKDQVAVMPYLTVSEDFAYYGQQVPSFFYFVGSTPQGQDPATAPNNHSPRFFLDEAALPIGVRTLTALALDYLEGR
ncbi:MAG TPA: amidohydrolase [Steroidobacteraceae bacterium]|nr:amidohydrolase [Steroidobacteraceae bacterium]